MCMPLYRVKKRSDIIGAFKMDPLYLKHDHQESGSQSVASLHHFAPYKIAFQLLTQSYKCRLVVSLALEMINRYSKE